MRARHPRLPPIWLITDERQGDALWTALERLPRGAGVIFRHHGTPVGERRALFEAVRRIARARRLTLVLAGTPRLAIGWRADGVHGRHPHGISARRLVRTAPAHNRRELVAAERGGADAILLSPVFPTRSHPGAPTLGRLGFAMIAHTATRPIIALGGMTASRARSLRGMGIHGWAGIDGLTRACSFELNRTSRESDS